MLEFYFDFIFIEIRFLTHFKMNADVIISINNGRIVFLLEKKKPKKTTNHQKIILHSKYCLIKFVIIIIFLLTWISFRSNQKKNHHKLPSSFLDPWSKLRRENNFNNIFLQTEFGRYSLINVRHLDDNVFMGDLERKLKEFLDKLKKENKK